MFRRGMYILPISVETALGTLTKSSGSSINFGSGTLSSQPSWNFNDLMSTNNWKYGYQAMWLGRQSSTDPGDGTSPPAAGVYKKPGNYSIGGSVGRI